MITIQVKMTIFASLLSLVSLGCTTATGPLTQTFGTAHTTTKMNQRLNPEASVNLEPVEGLSGEAAKRAIEKYYETFEREERRDTFILPVTQN